MYGMHWLDLTVIAIYMVAVAGIGIWAMRGIQNTEDYFMGSRKFGKLYSIFLQFGAGTSSDMPISVSRESFRNGMSGIWAVLLWLFVTPFYWVISPWYRRLRLITIGDFFSIRFDSKMLGAAYAVVGLVFYMYFIAIGLTAVGKTVEILTPKPETEYSVTQQRNVESFRHYRELGDKLSRGLSLSTVEQKKYDSLHDLAVQGKIRSGYSYLTSRMVIPAIAVIISLYCVLGGLKAAVLTDLIQGILIIFLSFVMIPFGLIKTGGFSGLHERVPEYMFNILGSPASSDYTILYIFSIVLINLVGIVAMPHIITTGGGAAKDELSARIGLCYGNYLKRLCTIGWALMGIIGFALYSKEISDPDMVWGYATHKLLAPGLVGLMLAAMLAAIMSSADVFMVSGSALFTLNIYKPLRGESSEEHFVVIGRVTSIIIIVGATLLALRLNNVLELLKYTWTLPVIFGSVFWMSILWRRVTLKAAWATVVFSLIFTIVLPNIMSRIDPIATDKNFLLETYPSSATVRVGADSLDVGKGLASEVGQLIEKKVEIKAVPVFFSEKVSLKNDDGERGIGRFRHQVWLLSLTGIDVRRFGKSALDAAVFILDATLPFVVLIIVSLLTRPVDSKKLDCFFARVHTPVQRTPEQDALALKRAEADPSIFEKRKFFPGTGLEIMKPEKIDILGFGIAVLVAVGIAGLAFIVAWTRWP